MKVIGLCGGSGSGKGSVSLVFADCGIPFIDTDCVYREMTSRDSECLRELSVAFGDNIVKSDGSLDRRKLSELVFSGNDANSRRKLLNSIAHRHILAETRRRIKAFFDDGARAVVVDAPLLFESGFDKECDFIVAVVADREVRIKRIMRRDGIERSAAIARIASQLTDDELIKRADAVVKNNGDLQTLRASVTGLCAELLND